VTYFVAKLSKTAQLPSRAHEGDAGLDLVSDVDLEIGPGEWARVETNVAGSLEPWHVGLVCPRSGLADRHGVTVLNAPGVVDANYRGNIGVILINHGKVPFPVVKGMRVAQLVIVVIPNNQKVVEVAANALPESNRGSNGFGSTGMT
jgi:dUTP pyrophosphatase